MMTKTLIVILMLNFAFAAYAQDTVFLTKSHGRPFMSVLKPAVKNSDIAVIICSGGSYGRTADREEGLPTAKLLAANGITAFLLDYRLPNGNDTLPLADVQAAIVYIREHKPADSLGIIGFSAGGHLVSSIGTHFQNRYGNTSIGANLRPDFMVLVYPVISMMDSLTHAVSKHNFLGDAPTPTRVVEFSNELQVTDQTPPTFLVAAVNDPVVYLANTLYFSAALQQHHVSTELFLYETGGHGFGIHNRTVTVQWTDKAIKWIKTGAWKTK